MNPVLHMNVNPLVELFMESPDCTGNSTNTQYGERQELRP
jgi:hypothetical protein